MNKKISIIIPAYNVEDYIQDCLNSIYNQTYQNYEVIIVNDGSTDNTLKKINEIKNEKVKVISIKNNGQGYARNHALKYATGDYVMFVDSDDFLEPVAFEVAINRIIKEKSDFVYFDWKYFHDKNKDYSYVSKENFFDKRILENEECTQLLGIEHYFTVNKLYDKNFLLKNDIKYGEHYIYEDVIFWLKVAIKAKKVSILHSPLYIVRINDKSTTKTNYDTDRHLKGLLRAFDDSIVLLNEKEKGYFLGYILKKFIVYYNKRMPKEIKKQAIDEIFKRISKYKNTKIVTRSRFMKLGLKYGILESKIKFKLFIFLSSKTRLVKKLIGFFRKVYQGLKDIIKKDYNLRYYKKYDGKLENNILFMGFDYRYSGNSRYLYEMMKDKNIDNMYFVTNSTLVDSNIRIKPKSKDFYKKLYTSRVVIFESWIPKNFKKPEGAIWINLWHGTPLKKMLYDSNEKDIISSNKNHKKDKFNAIKKMDYLLVDNENIKKYFNTSFLMNDDRLLAYGYPRVKYLIDNKDNLELKKEIRLKLNISDDEKMVLYLPTWRDYNYKEEEYDFSYLLDKDLLEKYLDDDKYKIITKDHAFLRINKDLSMTDIETQELLLACDCLITDYSSVLFDAFPIDKKVFVIAKDYDKYDESRGLYEDMWEDLRPFVVNDEKSLANLIKNYSFDENYVKIKKKYCYDSLGNIVDFILEKLD